jgi:hypothetical protein
MTTRREVERAIEAAIDMGGGEVIDQAIALLDELDGDLDREDDETEGDGCYLLLDDKGAPVQPWRYVDRDLDDEPGDQPPLMDQHLGGYQHGRLPVYDQCPCCGHREFAGYASPVIELNL